MTDRTLLEELPKTASVITAWIDRFSQTEELDLHEPVLLVQDWSGSDESSQYETSYRLNDGALQKLEPVVYHLVKAKDRPFPGQLGVGRTRNTDVCLPFSDISKYHACFFGQDGHWELMDAGSANGTAVDGVDLEARERVALHDEVTIRFARHNCIFLMPATFRKFALRYAELSSMNG